jgi:hypothetical protein
VEDVLILGDSVVEDGLDEVKNCRTHRKPPDGTFLNGPLRVNLRPSGVRAFSGKVGTGFPQKMRQNQKPRSLSDSIEPESDLEISPIVVGKRSGAGAKAQ